MRLVLRSTGRGLNAHGFRTKLEDMGYDLSKFSNPLVNILTAMNRMVEAEEMHWVEGEDKKTVVRGPELKPVPEAEAPPALPPGLNTLFPFLGSSSTPQTPQSPLADYFSKPSPLIKQIEYEREQENEKKK